MLPGFTNTDELNKYVRTYIIDYLKLVPNRVLNGVSVRGPDLQKIIDQCTLGSFNLEDSFIVFDLEKDNTGDYFVMQEDETTMSVISDFKINYRIYGMMSHMFGLQLQAMFKDENVLYSLYEKGVRIKDVSDMSTINEFINNTMWPRADLSATMQIRFIVRRKPDEYFDKNTESIFDSIHIVEQ